MAENKKKFGKGLSSLLGEKNLSMLSAKEGGELDLDLIVPNANQPRKNFNDESLNELVQSVKEYGILQPIIVRKVDDKYEIIAGERRYRSAKLAGLKTIPAIIRDFDNKDSFSLSIIENIQREDLNVIEEANAYRELMRKYSYTQQEISERIGKSRSHIANLLRLLNLPDTIQRSLLGGKIEMGHARALINCDFAEEIIDHIIDSNLSVRDVEKLVKDEKDASFLDKSKQNSNRAYAENEDDFSTEINTLEKKLNLKCNINYNNKSKKYNLSIKFSSIDELNDFIDSL
jgi:ParB family chromosome partitioning protein